MICKDGLAFTVGFRERNSTRIPSRLAQRLDGMKTPESERDMVGAFDFFSIFNSKFRRLCTFGTNEHFSDKGCCASVFY